jgi:hypothetical protein
MNAFIEQNCHDYRSIYPFNSLGRTWREDPQLQTYDPLKNVGQPQFVFSINVLTL